MSTKTIAVLNESELKDGEMRQVDFEGEGKVLVARLGDKIHATSAFCTHYGAPLAKGVLTADGRVVCPWHGACFNVCTGDIEDAPAPTAIHSFRAHIADGKIHVTANPFETLKANHSRQPKLLATGTGSGKGVVIVGGGSGTYHCIESLREHGYNGPLTVISKESYSPIDRTKLSKALITDASKLEWRSAAELKSKYGVTLRTGLEVSSIDADAKEVVIGGGERVSYETLVLATGGVPRRLPVEGANLDNVYTLRGVEDAQRIDAACQEGKRLVVIGSSFISMELVVAVSSRKLASIDVVGLEEVPFESILGKEVGAGLKKFHESKGVHFHMNASVEKLVASKNDSSKAEAVIISGKDGQLTLSADAVIMGVGVAPATEFLKHSKGFESALEKSGAVLVDEYLKVKGLDGAYAIGDIAMYPQPGTGELRRIEHWNVAGNQGRAVGRTIAEGKPQPYVKIPVFWSAQGQQLRYCGVGANFDDVIITGNPDEMKFIAYYVKNNKVVAVASMQYDPVVSKASELMRLDLMPSPTELKAGKNLLSVDIQTVSARNLPDFLPRISTTYPSDFIEYLEAMSTGVGKSLSSKAKASLSDSQFDDLNPVITYRHVQSHNMGVRDPLRVIALCDSDAFYAACEQVRLGLDPSVPLVVQQWDSLIAVNYPARTYGITRMEKVKEARRKCPELTVVHVATFKEGEKEPGYWKNPDTLTHKVSLDYYRRESMKIITMFQEGLPTGEIEKASIDEAFIDFTRPVREEILRRYPYLAEVPPDAPNGIDSPVPSPPPIIWSGLGTVVFADHEPQEIRDDAIRSQRSARSRTHDESSEGVKECDSSTTWHDVALSIAAELMGRIRRDIHEKLGYTTSAGLARNKFLAKLTASYKKPNSQSILRNAAIPNYLRPIAFQKIRFLGGKLGKAIAEEFDASTVGDLLLINLEEMQRKLGENSIWVYEILRGIDRSEVKEKSFVNKSMMASKNLPQPVTNETQGYHWIRVLAAELALRLTEARDQTPALWPKTLVLHVRQGYDTARSKQAPFPFSRHVDIDIVASAGDKLWRELVGTDTSRAAPVKITHIALGFTGVESMEAGQQSIEGFFHTPAILDRTRPSSSSATKRSRDPDDNPVSRETVRSRTEDSFPRSQVTSFTCDRCGKRVYLADELASNHPGNEVREALAVLRVEHDDFHLAQDLAKQIAVSSPRKIRPSEKAKSSKNKKQPQRPEGIAKFFAKK
ncbi:uncharacterized protein FIBRA_04379 [Fibroporia radiculosa]|uniref:DNA polymerase eta n=1 Tax=Fibroporia radiculosa TaxID=599839 RepID=J4IA49_9APHY|nr:uncharacterized protein FIBRA_04379 [Fibroporia radiculosa]CCM02291.1 predicted protein [Fibroporia radiculosa]